VRARITTPWVGTGTFADPYRPAVGALFTLSSFQDITGVVPSATGTFDVEVEAADTVISQIEAAGYPVVRLFLALPGS
jgi:hypothetical protein